MSDFEYVAQKKNVKCLGDIFRINYLLHNITLDILGGANVIV